MVKVKNMTNLTEYVVIDSPLQAMSYIRWYHDSWICDDIIDPYLDNIFKSIDVYSMSILSSLC